MFKRQCVVVFFIFLGFANLLMGQTYTKPDQDYSPASIAASDEVIEVVLKRLPPVVTMNAMMTDGPYMVRALAVGFSNYKVSSNEYAMFDFFAEYYSGQTWYMCLAVANYSNTAVAIKTRWDLYYNDGAGRLTKYYSQTIFANTVMAYYIPITAYIAKKGLFTLNGQVYGPKMGNDNAVKSQVYIY